MSDSEIGGQPAINIIRKSPGSTVQLRVNRESAGVDPSLQKATGKARMPVGISRVLLLRVILDSTERICDRLHLGLVYLETAVLQPETVPTIKENQFDEPALSYPRKNISQKCNYSVFFIHLQLSLYSKN